MERGKTSRQKWMHRFKFKNLKIWAVRGEMEYKGHRLWEGADMENEGM